MSDYIKTNWQNGDIITAEKLNNIENGIAKGYPKFIQIRQRFPNFLQEPTKENMESFRQEFICDPNAINPTKKVYGLYKILSKNLECSDFIGTIFERIVEQRAATIIHTTVITGAESIIGTSGLSEFASYIKLIAADEEEGPFLYYFPTTGYFGEASLLGRMILDLGYISLDNSGTQVSLDIEPQISISELHNLSDNGWIPYAIENGQIDRDQWSEGEIEFLDDHSARIDFDLGGAKTISILLSDEGQSTISGVNSAIGATGIISDFAIIMCLSI